MYYSWNTTKTETGFTYTICKNTRRDTPNEIGHYVDRVIVESKTCATRAQAVGAAKRFIRYLKDVR